MEHENTFDRVECEELSDTLLKVARALMYRQILHEGPDDHLGNDIYNLNDEVFDGTTQYGRSALSDKEIMDKLLLAKRQLVQVVESNGLSFDQLADEGEETYVHRNE